MILDPGIYYQTSFSIVAAHVMAVLPYLCYIHLNSSAVDRQRFDADPGPTFTLIRILRFRICHRWLQTLHGSLLNLQSS
jgi:hypothetical protein